MNVILRLGKRSISFLKAAMSRSVGHRRGPRTRPQSRCSGVCSSGASCRNRRRVLSSLHLILHYVRHIYTETLITISVPATEGETNNYLTYILYHYDNSIQLPLTSIGILSSILLDFTKNIIFELPSIIFSLLIEFSLSPC